MAAAFSVLFVCTANMCRSPTAHAVFRKMVREGGLDAVVAVDSAGTRDLYIDSPPDERSLEHAARRGYDLSDLRARHIQDADFERADLILVMDWNNMEMLRQRCPAELLPKVKRLTEFCRRPAGEIVPDPYRGEAPDFEHVLDLVEDACAGLLAHVRAQPALAQARRAP